MTEHEATPETLEKAVLEMAADVREAYEWARLQKFQSVAARYARTLALWIEQLRLAALKEPKP